MNNMMRRHLFHQKKSFFHTTTPTLFDKKRFFAAKKLWKSQTDIENTTFTAALKTLRTYALGQDSIATLHLKLQRTEAGRPVRGSVTLPKQPSTAPDSNSRILVFAKGECAKIARELGADLVGGEELVEEVLAGKHVFHKVLSSMEMFPHVVKIARYLGPKGLMPSPSRGTVSDDIELMMSTLRASSKYEMDTDGFIHFDIARMGWSEQAIRDNIVAFLGSLEDVRPSKTSLIKFVARIGVSGPGTPGVVFPRKELIGEKVEVIMV